MAKKNCQKTLKREAERKSANEERYAGQNGGAVKTARKNGGAQSGVDLNVHEEFSDDEFEEY